MRWILNFRVDEEILSSSAFCSCRALVVLPEEGRPEKMMRGITTLSSSWLLDCRKGGREGLVKKKDLQNDLQEEGNHRSTIISEYLLLHLITSSTHQVYPHFCQKYCI
jgi:hypothetical protein